MLVVTDPELAANALPAARALRAANLERRQVEPERHDGEAAGVRDAEPDEVVADLLADGDQQVGATRQPSLDLAIDGGRARREIARQRVSVEGVDQDRPRAAAEPRDQRGAAAERPCLSRVRVDDVRPLAADDPDQRDQRPDVMPARVAAKG